MNVESLWCGAGRSRADLRRQRIIEAARILFVNNGFHATGVAQIAKASGIAVGQIYRDFEAKEDIVAAIVEGDCSALLERDSLCRAINRGDVPAVWAWIRGFLRPDGKNSTEFLFAEIVAESVRNQRIAAIFARAHEDVGGDVRAALRLLLPGEGLCRRRERLADFIMAQSFGLAQLRLLRPEVETDELVDMAVSAIAREIEGR